METVRCGKCQRKLAEAQYTRLEIKCTRCGTLNVLRASAADHSSPSPTPERPRAPSKTKGKDGQDSRAPGAH
ncbi:MAG: Com family DNA-binding transcriptional regulator [Burkholderiaceae bacterium]|nr:Com family DNA-binding transcriptional regulator [Burkholderiaceae bacterium]